MAKSPKPKPVKHQPSPQEYGYKPEQLCRVVSQHGIVMERGTLLARRGAWQGKSVVNYCLYDGTEESQYHVVNGEPVVYDVWTVGIEFLGNFYANGKIELAAPQKQRRIREFQVKVPVGQPLTHGLGGYDGGLVPVVPSLDIPDKILWVDKTEVAAQKAAKAAATKQAKLEWEAKKKAPVKIPAPEPKPESILAKFLID